MADRRDLDALRHALDRAATAPARLAAHDALIERYVQRGMVQLAAGHWSRAGEVLERLPDAAAAATRHARRGGVLALLLRDRGAAITRLDRALELAQGAKLERPWALAALLRASLSLNSSRPQLRAVFELLASANQGAALADLRLYHACLSLLAERLGERTLELVDLERALALQGEQLGAELLEPLVAELLEHPAQAFSRWPQRDLSASHVLQELAGDFEQLEPVVALEAARAALEVSGEEASQAPISLIVGVERGAWFKREGASEPVALSTRGALRGIFSALLEHHILAGAPGLSVEQLFEAGWPGSDLSLTSKRARVYVAVRELRELGLEELLCSGERGYRLADHVRLRFER